MEKQEKIMCDCGCGRKIDMTELDHHTTKRGLRLYSYQCLETAYADDIPEDEDFIEN